MTHPTHDPEPIVLEFQHDGLGLTFLGEDFEYVIALGHHPADEFLAAAAHLAANQGVDHVPTPENCDGLEWDAALDDVQHSWAIRLPVCPNPDTCWLEMCIKPDDLDVMPWIITEEDETGNTVTANTPGAFPITTLDVGDEV